MAAIDEKRFTALGQEWVARFDFNAICEMEERTGQSFFALVSPFLNGLTEADKDDQAKVLAAAKAIRVSDVRMVLHQSLLACQPETTLADTGNIVGDIGLDKAMEVVGWAIMKGMPGQKEGAKRGAANPRKGRPAPTG